MCGPSNQSYYVDVYVNTGQNITLSNPGNSSDYLISFAKVSNPNGLQGPSQQKTQSVHEAKEIRYMNFLEWIPVLLSIPNVIVSTLALVQTIKKMRKKPKK
jgi:hypothetical protein